MAQPAGQNKLPNQTPNAAAPIASVDVDVSTMLKDSKGQPVTGVLSAFGYITPAWRYLLGNLPSSTPRKVAQLPAASTLTGTRLVVSDATATTFNSVVAGGGTNTIPVFSDGKNWRIG